MLYLLLSCRYLTEVVFQKPLIVYNYPKGIKAFYMRLNDDGKTVAAMDVLVPKVIKDHPSSSPNTELRFSAFFLWKNTHEWRLLLCLLGWRTHWWKPKRRTY